MASNILPLSWKKSACSYKLCRCDDKPLVACNKCKRATYCSDLCKHQDSNHHQAICIFVSGGKRLSELDWNIILDDQGIDCMNTYKTLVRCNAKSKLEFEFAWIAWKFAIDVCTFDAMSFAVKTMMADHDGYYYPWIPLGLLYLGRDMDAIKYIDLCEAGRLMPHIFICDFG